MPAQSNYRRRRPPPRRAGDPAPSAAATGGSLSVLDFITELPGTSATSGTCRGPLGAPRLTGCWDRNRRRPQGPPRRPGPRQRCSALPGRPASEMAARPVASPQSAGGAPLQGARRRTSSSPRVRSNKNSEELIIQHILAAPALQPRAATSGTQARMAGSDRRCRGCESGKASRLRRHPKFPPHSLGTAHPAHAPRRGTIGLRDQS